MWSVTSLFLTLLPILVIIILLVVFKKSADFSGIIGWILVSIIAILFFKTSFEVVFRSTFAGLIKSFSVSLVVATSLFQMAYMEKTGALRRFIIFLKTISSENKAVQIMMINIGFGTLMVAVGATPVSLLPPILVAMGYSTYVSIALPAIGYDSLCTYALLGAPIVVFTTIIPDISLSDAGKVFHLFLPIISTLIGFSMLWIVDRWNGIKKGFLPCIVTGLVISVVSYFTNQVNNLVILTGVLSGIAVILAMAIYLLVTGKKIIDKTSLSDEEKSYEKQYPLIKALLPWLILIIIILCLNIPENIFNFLYNKNTFPINNLTADGSPIGTRFLWNAYTWIFVSTLISIPFMKPKKSQLIESLKTWWKRAPRPVFSAAIFFAIGEIMNMSGFDMAKKSFSEGSNMIKILADASASAFENIYAAIVPFIGLFGGFITGSEASTIGMFAKYTLTTSKNLGLDKSSTILVVAALAFGGGLASVISPAKLQNAAAAIDKIGEEHKVIKTAFVFSLLLTSVTATFAFFILKSGILL